MFYVCTEHARAIACLICRRMLRVTHVYITPFPNKSTPAFSKQGFSIKAIAKRNNNHMPVDRFEILSTFGGPDTVLSLKC